MKLIKFYIFNLLLMGNVFAQTPEQKKLISDSYDANRKLELRTYFENYHQEINQKVSKLDTDNLSHNPSNIYDVTKEGIVIYYEPTNLGAAITLGADKLYDGGGLNLSLDGTNMVAGVWEAFEAIPDSGTPPATSGTPLTAHLDLTGRVTNIDNPQNAISSNHATHVTGTIISSGERMVNNLGRGVAFNASALNADISDIYTELDNEASNGLLVSNHSYGLRASAIPTSFFGAYIGNSYNMDLLTSVYDFHLPVVAAGNDRNSASQLNPTKNGFELITGIGTSKNTITVAAINAVTNYTSPSSVTMSSFSNWGPIDDGRIKPDISSKGTSVLSTTNANPSSYNFNQGTSMAAPGISGLLLLLQEHYNDINSNFMKAATAKGLLLHTAREAGSAQGPDYRFGWGVGNGEKAAQTITNNGVDAFIEEETLTNGATRTLAVEATGNEPLMVSISWTDVADDTKISEALDDRDPDLVNDLDLKVSKDGTDYFPWKLDPMNPEAAATRNSTNDVDVFEKVEVDNPTAGEVYTVTINHKGSLQGANQNYSLIITGGVPTNLSVNDVATAADELVIYPNPSADVAYIKANDVNVKAYELFDLTGKIVDEGEFDANASQPSVNLQSLEKGVYFIRIYSDKGIISRKVTKK